MVTNLFKLGYVNNYDKNRYFSNFTSVSQKLMDLEGVNVGVCRFIVVEEAGEPEEMTGWATLPCHSFMVYLVLTCILRDTFAYFLRNS